MSGGNQDQGEVGPAEPLLKGPSSPLTPNPALCGWGLTEGTSNQEVGAINLFKS